MSRFILATLLLSLLAGAFVALPLLRRRSGLPRAAGAASAAVLALLIAGAALYGWLGDRAALEAVPGGAGQGTASPSIVTLARHLEHDPQDLHGWIDLGQAYATLGNYSLALRCFQRANRLSGGSNAMALAGMAEAMLMSGDTTQTSKAAELLERALKIDPRSAKALFYSAVIAYQQGHLPLARERFQAMLAFNLSDEVRTALRRQIEDIDAQLRPSAAEHAAGKLDPATAIHLHVTLSPALADKVPPAATLFVFVRAPAGGPPLAAKRSEVRLPQDVDLSAADAMVAGRSVQPGEDVSVVARISSSGNALPQSGDLYGEIRYVAGKSGARALQIDKLSP